MLALKLNTQLAYGASYQACGQTAHELLLHRQGTRWQHTRDTSWAIEALANMLGFIPRQGLVRNVQVVVAGKIVLDIRDAEGLKKMNHRVHLSADQLPKQEAIEVIVKADQRHDDVCIGERQGSAAPQREQGGRHAHQDGNESWKPLTANRCERRSRPGRRIASVCNFASRSVKQYLLVEERRPALCEFADDRIDGTAGVAPGIP